MGKRIEEMSRRELLKIFGISVGAVIADPAAWPRNVQAQSKKVTPRGTARNVIVVQNCGAMSQWETWDFRPTKYTDTFPGKDLDVQKVNADFQISKTLFPQYQKWAPKAALVRTLWENSLVHFTGMYHSQAGRAFNPAILREVPAYGSIVAMELENQRKASDTFPTFMSVDLWNTRCPQIGSGMLHPKYSGLDLNTSTVFESFGGADAKAETDLSRRWEVLNRMAEVSPSGSGDGLGGKAEEYSAHYQYAYKILMDPRFKKVLAVTDEEKQRYGVDKDKGVCKLGLAMLLARNVLASDAGTRFMWVSNAYNGNAGGNDNHDNIYGRGALAPRGFLMPIYDSAPRLDAALGSLIEDLSKMPGKESGKTMLDETMVVVLHEFGRNPDFNLNNGRDHWGPVYSDVFIGGGVKPGRIIGKTEGGKPVDIGWGYKQQPMKDHVTATVYSALGIDYSKKIEKTPSGRAYEYQQTAPLGGPAFIPLTDIAELFV
ncbi:MAG: hypothetical protein AUI45_09830 [Acidobacteria bacterium 13_1_40CM_2_56_11]|nr:MAG: hypothetical protein AUI45_09830 [Acidobacteria bacterium 13_1_40CM_2_56_11]